MKINRQILSNVTFWIIVPFIFVVILITVFSFYINPFRIRVFSVLSGSMEPTIPTGSLILVKGLEDYEVGDVVTYKITESRFNDKTKVSTVTHRITNKEQDGGNILFTTKGDANEGEDINLVPSKTVLGKVVFEIPFLGYIIRFARNPFGFLFLVLIPVFLIVKDDFYTISKELKKRRKGSLKIDTLDAEVKSVV